ncbi:MAG: YtxH domain-containing protein [Actinomycetota bacterium]|nr:YtxH domain-containing protein [Actinomycetota bacterium]
MSDNKQGQNSLMGIVISLFTGLFIGTIIGMLYAPKSGKETRKK